MATIDTILNSVLERSRRRLITASLKSNALVAWAFASGRVETEPGGYNITNPLVTGRNPNVASYTYYSELPVAQTNEFDRVEYTWSRVAGTVIISDQEQDENRGEAAVFRLMRAKMEVLERSIREKFSTFLYGAGAGNDPNGLAALIPDDPTTGTLGGISRAAETQWRTSAYDFNGNLNETNIEEAFDDILMDLTMDASRPDIILCGRNIYRFYRAAVRDKVTINIGEANNGRGMRDLGFTGIAHQAIPMVYDEDCPVNKAYFINSEYLKLHMLRGVNMKVKQLVAPWNIDAVGRRIVWQGQWCLWRAFRTHAVLINE